MSEPADIVVLGSLNADLVQRVDRVPWPGETLQGKDLETFAGGKGATQAGAAGRMGAKTAMAILDPAPSRTLGGDLLRNVDLLTPNETEALTLLRRDDSIETLAQAEVAAKQLLSLCIGTVVLKLGHKVACWPGRDSVTQSRDSESRLSTTKAGAQNSVPSRGEVERFLCETP